MLPVRSVLRIHRGRFRIEEVRLGDVPRLLGRAPALEEIPSGRLVGAET